MRLQQNMPMIGKVSKWGLFSNRDSVIPCIAISIAVRIIRSVLKLDKNFHIYITGSRDWIEKGYDEATGRHYYKLYFNSES